MTNQPNTMPKQAGTKPQETEKPSRAGQSQPNESKRETQPGQSTREGQESRDNDQRQNENRSNKRSSQDEE